MAFHNLIRLIFALIFLVGAGANMVLLTARPGTYEGFADLAIVPLYKTLWRDVVVPRLTLWVSAVIVFEVVLAVLLLARGVYPRIGLILASAFMLFLFPFWWGGGAIINLVFLAVLFWLLRFDYPASMLTLLFSG